MRSGCDQEDGFLIDTDLSIKDIASEVGYSNSYYFIKIFKEHRGMTPGEYRKYR